MIIYLPTSGTPECRSTHTYVFYIYAIPMTSYLQGHLKKVNIQCKRILVLKGRIIIIMLVKHTFFFDKIKLKATNRFNVDLGDMGVVWKSPCVSIFYDLDMAVPLSSKHKIKHLCV